ncbi:hypothetical protein C8F04DRAFT_1081757 [Mycena alexandri]|uniref:Zn(2)-C6 fungal-type domain-containing protein n=1 Tax=Mycena alexandri TaxID=1745969 RepID=A0AAD6X6D0_9AGAR|nr:hypothetical protein C8F04DRAFT_1081757 [Mycena alexandri]
MPSPQPPEKSKKVSRACNTCRLKRKKCDGLEPCIFCTDTKVECSYSREPRRRGPPSGYLRYTETRVTLLETLLGLFIQTSGPQTAQQLFDAVKTLRTESSTNTQEIWDAYKLTWTDSDGSRATPAIKPLLPLSGKQSQAPPPPPSVSARSPSPFPATLSYRNESFERTVTHEPLVQSEGPSMHEQNPPPHPQAHPPHVDVVDMDLSMPMFLTPPPTEAATPLYTGAYWRTAALASPSPTFASLPPPLSPTLADLSFPPDASPIADLPPQHVCAALLATYHTDVHPSLPILSPTQCGTPDLLEASPMLLLALCAYTARLAPPAVPTRVAADVWYESACALLSAALRRAVVSLDVLCADHGRARDAMAWRGVGAAARVAVELGLDGSETNSRGSTDPGEDAWKRSLWGVISMLDLFLSIQLGHAPASAEALRPLSFSPQPSLNPITSMNTPTSRNALPSPSPSVASATTSPSTTLFRSTPIHAGSSSAGPDTALFTHTRTLVRIIARVHFCVTLGYGEAPSSSSASVSAATSPTPSFLRDELAAWHRGLPQRFRVALGGERVSRAVLEAHMLYQVGAGMLAWAGTSTSSSASGGMDADAAADEATSTFNVLLDKYRPSLALAGPHVVWLVFAAARAGLRRASPVKNGLGVGAGPGTARALQTQLYLLNCREALAAMGETWELARRCAHTLERLTEGGESRPQSSNAGKRKREDDAAEEESGAKRRDVVRERGEEGAPGWAEQFEFDAGWGAGVGSAIDPFGMSVDGLWGTDGGSAGSWGAGQWDESLVGQLSPGTGRGLGMGLFDAPPGG